MTHADLIAGAVIVAVLAALVADVAAFGARRDAARALLSAHTHPKRRDPPAPRNLAVDRRLADQGPPPGSLERRHRAPDDARATRRGTTALREGTAEQFVTVDRPLTVDEAAEIRARFVRETITGSGTGRPQGLLPAVGAQRCPHCDVGTIGPTGRCTRCGIEQPPGPPPDELPTAELHPPTRDVRAVRPDQQP